MIYLRHASSERHAAKSIKRFKFFLGKKIYISCHFLVVFTLSDSEKYDYLLLNVREEVD